MRYKMHWKWNNGNQEDSIDLQGRTQDDRDKYWEAYQLVNGIDHNLIHDVWLEEVGK